MRIGLEDVDRLSIEQRQAYDTIAEGPRGSVPLPFLAMMDAPHLVEVIQAVGAAIRYSGVVSAELREIAILATAAAFGSNYEWTHHLAIARQLNVPEAAIAAAASGDLAAEPLSAVYATAIALCRAAVLDHRVNPDHLADLIGMIGREAASEIVAISGYYPLLGLFLSAAGADTPVVYPA
jgi:4-carboxymuconolactone decarboxylase